jgi:DNA/RNA-binding domain of Phe-tRNA-synthetase-like protein
VAVLSSSVMLIIEPHPLLDLGAFVTELPGTPTPPHIATLLATGASAPFASSDEIRGAVRDMLRKLGYKPTGRGKPASEYLLKAVAEGTLGSINLAVDAGNAVSLHSGLPISVVDLDRVKEPLRVAVGGAGMTYVFNASGQAIDVEGLPCLFDADGPCANAVKDAQRSKTTPETRRTLSLVWGAQKLGDRTARTVAWYRELLEKAGAKTSAV